MSGPAPALPSGVHPVPESARDYLEGVAGDGSIARRNEAAWQRWSIVPRVLRTPESVDAATSVLGIASSAPLWVAPTAAHGLGHPAAERAAARAAAATGHAFALSQAASLDVEDVAPLAGDYVQQIYLPQDRPAIEPFLERVVAAAAKALLFTVDLSPPDSVHAFRLGIADVVPYAAPERPPLPAGTGVARSLRPEDIGWLHERTGLPVLVKGVLHPDDALLAIEAGAAGVVVSNHGGREVGGGITSAAALPEVVRAVAGRAVVLVDSGIRSADDVFRAVALGADAALVGRPIVRALWDRGEEGPAEVLSEFRTQFEHLLRVTGHPDVAALRTSGAAALRSD